MGKITVLGLGPGDYTQLTIGVFEKIKAAEKLILRTEKHPVVDYIREKGIIFESCDDLYDSGESFEEVYEKISKRVLAAAESAEEVVYAVPGHPLVAEKSVEHIIEKAKGGLNVEIIPSMSFIDAIMTSLKTAPGAGLKIIDGLSLDSQKPDIRCANIITQVYSRFVASDVKLKLMDYYHDDFEIYIIRAAGIQGLEKVEKIKLYELDRIEWVDYLTSLYIPAATDTSKYKTMDDLIEIMQRLRGENGCPWDREQTHHSLKPYLLEETYEVLDAIDKENIEHLVEELGDLLLHVVFHSQIGSEEGSFDIRDVITGIVDKLIVRHPHVFGDVQVTEESGALRSWEASKRKLKGIDNYTQTLEDIPESLPSLIRSYKIQEKAALAGFDWDNADGAMAKLEEEINEVKEVYKTGKIEKIEEEIGDLIFAAVNVARFLKVQPELALKATIDKFIRRFRFIEEEANKMGQKLDKMTLKEMDALWEKAKIHNFSKKD